MEIFLFEPITMYSVGTPHWKGAKRPSCSVVDRWSVHVAWVHEAKLNECTDRDVSMLLVWVVAD